LARLKSARVKARTSPALLVSGLGFLLIVFDLSQVGLAKADNANAVWYRRKTKDMRKAAQTVQHHLSVIQNWVRSRINNGILEGLNSIIQAAKRKARGYGKKHFATIAFLLTGKLNLQKVNPFLPTRFG
jgi:hypothetical protein